MRESLVPRPRLLKVLNDSVLSRRLTLVSAPAGYGKTTLLAALPRAFSELTVAWLSLDAEDNDPAGFLAAVVAALQKLNPEYGGVTQTVLESLPDPGTEVRRVVGVLINDISEMPAEPFVLVLDDLHMIHEPAVYAALELLIERMPDQMHLVIATRQDPPLALARFRARGYLAELRLDDLRFTQSEIEALLAERLQVDLPADERAALEVRTGGWIAGLRLLVGSLGHQSATGQDAVVAPGAQVDRHVFDLLSEEVLDRQEPEVRDFLLQTSILEELTPEVCRAVTEMEDAARMLEEIYRRNLFLSVVDEVESRGPVYRYHDLFAEFLRGRLARERPDGLRELHRRAAEALADPGHAVRHYLAAGMWPAAARVIEQSGPELLYLGMIERLRGWISALPPEVREERPRLAHLLGSCAVRQGDFATAQVLLEQASRGFDAEDEPVEKAASLLELVRIASGSGNLALTENLLAQIEESPVPIPPRQQVQIHILRAWQKDGRQQWPDVAPHVSAAVDITMGSGDPGSFNVLALGLRAPFLLGPDGTAKIEHYCHKALERFGDGVNLIRAGSQSLLGYAQLLRGEFEEAARMAESARGIGNRLGGLADVNPEIDQILSARALVCGDYAAFDLLWEERLPRIERHDILRTWLGGFLYWVGKAYWSQNRTSEARNIHSRLKAIDTPPNFPDAEVARTMMDGLIAMGDRRYEAAERSFSRAVSMRPDPLYSTLFWIGDPRLLLALLYHRWGRPRLALRELEPVLDACSRRDTPGLILREGKLVEPLLQLARDNDVHVAFAGSMLEVLGGSGRVRPVEVPTTGETLTSREVEVLRLVAGGATNRDIAGRLFVSERTVKSHMTRTHLINTF
ncbi:MAG: LuxR C-terminal-related transcriptional regulator [Rubrobacteraceae bacterium]